MRATPYFVGPSFRADSARPRLPYIARVSKTSPSVHRTRKKIAQSLIYAGICENGRKGVNKLTRTSFEIARPWNSATKLTRISQAPRVQAGSNRQNRGFPKRTPVETYMFGACSIYQKYLRSLTKKSWPTKASKTKPSPLGKPSALSPVVLCPKR